MHTFVYSLVLFFFATSAFSASLQNAESDASPKPQQVVSYEKMNLNQADEKSLTKVMKGIGKKRAAAIIQYRNQHGSFASIEELAKVRGLGEKFVNSHLSELQAAFKVN